jgi:hypothetical protein
MAIEIRELIIKMTVQDKVPVTKDVSGELSNDKKNALIKECVQKVLETLETKIER